MVDLLERALHVAAESVEFSVVNDLPARASASSYISLEILKLAFSAASSILVPWCPFS